MEAVQDTYETNNPSMSAPLKNMVADYIDFLAHSHAPRVEKKTYNA
jgi:hypothetical protein